MFTGTIVNSLGTFSLGAGVEVAGATLPATALWMWKLGPGDVF